MARVRLFAAAAAAAGEKELDTTATTLSALKAELAARNDELARVLLRCTFLVDGAAVLRDDERDITHADHVDVLPPFAGG
ncbi:MAG TPA: MoaD/ThiS family protein [Mycobacteriales bacterium]|nr:MoaD/ThiS family protein [Mycobacteriales bacterium]